MPEETNDVVESTEEVAPVEETVEAPVEETVSADVVDEQIATAIADVSTEETAQEQAAPAEKVEVQGRAQSLNS